MIDIDNFINITEFIQFKNQKKIKIENIDEINYFYSKEYNSKHKPFYHLNPLYNTLLNCNQFQYMVVDCDEDRVFFTYKLIQIMKLKQVRVIGKPISEHNNIDSINKIENKLNSLPFVRLVYMNKQNGFEPLVEYDDYFYDFTTHNFNSKYKSKCGINKILQNEDFEILITHGVSQEFISSLRESWVKDMNSCGNTVSNKNTKDFYKIVTYDNDSIINIVLLYKSKPISIQTFMINNQLRYADCLYINHLGRSKSDDVELCRALRNMTKIQNWLAYDVLNKIGISMVYIAGCRPSEKRLLKHKSKITDGALRYYIK